MKQLLLPILFMMMFSSVSYGKSDKRGHRLAQKLDLSSEQIEKIKTHRKENKGKGREIRSQMKQAKAEFDKAFLNGESDSGLKALHSKLKNLRTSQMDLQYNKLVFMKSVLTKEQRQKFISLKKERKKRKGKK